MRITKLREMCKVNNEGDFIQFRAYRRVFIDRLYVQLYSSHMLHSANSQIPSWSFLSVLKFDSFQIISSPRSFYPIFFCLLFVHKDEISYIFNYLKTFIIIIIIVLFFLQTLNSSLIIPFKVHLNIAILPVYEPRKCSFQSALIPFLHSNIPPDPLPSSF